MRIKLWHLGKLAHSTISTYLQRMEVFFQANGVADAKQVAVLLSCIGAKTYGVLNLLAPDEPVSKTLAVL